MDWERRFEVMLSDHGLNLGTMNVAEKNRIKTENAVILTVFLCEQEGLTLNYRIYVFDPILSRHLPMFVFCTTLGCRS